MDIKNLFQYIPSNNYNFTLKKDNTNLNLNENETKIETTSTSLDSNLNFVKNSYTTSINSDVIIRDFSLIAQNKEYSSFLLYIDGLSDPELINNYILKPLMLRNQANTFENNNSSIDNTSKNITAKKIKKENLCNTTNLKDFDLKSFIYKHLLPQNSVSETNNFKKIFSSVNSGNCILFVDSLNICFDIDTKGFKQRSIDKPNIENVIKGPQEAFVENLRTNTSIIRRIINNQNLIIENLSIGKLSQTKCAVCYLKNIANNSLISETKTRIENLSIDTLISSGQLEQLIEDEGSYGIPQILSTERPDKCAKALFQGRIVILLNGNPYALIVPAVVTDFLSSPEDSNLKPLFGNFLRLIRIIALLITLLLPGIYVSITSFHQELLPTELMFSIFASRENVPFPVIVELLLMEISFELIREGGLRTPSAIGSTLGIVGALILGDAAVTANIVSPFLIIVVAITGLASFALPDFTFGFHLRIYRFIFTIIGFAFGFLGIGLGFFIYISILCSLKSFGVSYTEPLSPDYSNSVSNYFISPYWKQEYRQKFLHPKKIKSQSKLSMKWKLKRKDD